MPKRRALFAPRGRRKPKATRTAEIVSAPDAAHNERAISAANAARNGCSISAVDAAHQGRSSGIIRLSKGLQLLPREVLRLVYQYHPVVRERALDKVLNLLATSGPDADDAKLTELKQLHRLFDFYRDEVWTIREMKYRHARWSCGRKEHKLDDNAWRTFIGDKTDIGRPNSSVEYHLHGQYRSRNGSVQTFTTPTTHPAHASKALDGTIPSSRTSFSSFSSMPVPSAMSTWPNGSARHFHPCSPAIHKLAHLASRSFDSMAGLVRGAIFSCHSRSAANRATWSAPSGCIPILKAYDASRVTARWKFWAR